jgi:hypothetical protein
VALWPQFDVLIANPGRLASLTGQQRAWLGQAAKDTNRDSVRLASRTSPNIREACMMGARFVNATSADLAALRGALSVVYQQMEHDPQASVFIRQIQRLKKSTPPGPALRIPAGCTTKP